MARVTSLKSEKSKRKAKSFAFNLVFFIIIVVLSTAALLFFSNPGIAASLRNALGQNGSASFPITYSRGIIKDLKSVSGNIAVLSDTYLTIFSKNGFEKYNIAHNMSSPVLKTSDKRFLLYSSQSKTLRVDNLNQNVYINNYAQTVYDATISNSGHAAVLLGSEIHMQEIIVYSPSGDEIFKATQSDNHIYGIALSPDGRHLATKSINTLKGVMQTSITVYDIGTGKSSEPVVIYEDFVYSLQFKTNADLIAITGKRCISLSETAQIMATSDFDGTELFAYCDKTKGYTGVMLKNLSGEGYIFNIYDTKCEKVSFEVESEVWYAFSTYDAMGFVIDDNLISIDSRLAKSQYSFVEDSEFVTTAAGSIIYSYGNKIYSGTGHEPDIKSLRQ